MIRFKNMGYRLEEFWVRYGLVCKRIIVKLRILIHRLF